MGVANPINDVIVRHNSREIVKSVRHKNKKIGDRLKPIVSRLCQRKQRQ